MAKKNFAESSEKCVGVIPLEFRESDEAGDKGLPTLIHLVPIGAWDHDLYGDMKISASDIQEFVQNFNAKIRNGVFITAGHEGFSELPAVAWITSVVAKEDGLWGVPDWNSLGKEALTDKQYKFLSPEFYPTYEDPQSHMIYHNVLTGAALTKSPYFKELTALVMSDKIIQTNKFSTMDLSTLLAKKKSDLSQEEKGHIKKNKDKLSDAQLKEYKDIVGEDEDDNDADDEEAKKKKASEDAAAADEAAEAEKKAAEEANIAAGLNADGTEKVNASEKVQITASELAALRAAADKGALAFKELEATKIAGEVGKMIFSATNKAGAFLPKEEADLKKFMESLTASQRLTFSSLISKVRIDKAIFTEAGTDTTATEGTALAEVNAKVEAKMKANDKMKYSEALKEVMSENKGLEERFDSELPSARKGKE